MNTIAAVFRDGVFAPDGYVALSDGVRVVLHVESVLTSSHSGVEPAPPPDETWEAEEQPAPCDLPNGCGVIVRAHDGLSLLPDPPLCELEVA